MIAHDIPARNKYMVDQSQYAICYVDHGWGGAAQTYDRAKKKGLTMRTVKEALAEIRSFDADSAVTENCIRVLCKMVYGYTRRRSGNQSQ